MRLSENENSLLTQAGAIGRTLQELQRVDSGAANLVELHSQAVSAHARFAERNFRATRKKWTLTPRASPNSKNGSI